jgi:(p)ppGpp synthase/HD superfamily hydrolase
MQLMLAALDFAARAHAGQVRKYTGEPCINHPIEVANIVASVPHDEAMLAAAFLHDVVEDCGVTNAEVAMRFGSDVAELVHWLTGAALPADGNRAVRKAIDRAHIAAAPPRAKTVKLADILSNIGSIVARDPGFAQVYMAEKARLLPFLTEGDVGLLADAQARIDTYYA